MFEFDMDEGYRLLHSDTRFQSIGLATILKEALDEIERLRAREAALIEGVKTVQDYHCLGKVEMIKFCRGEHRVGVYLDGANREILEEWSDKAACYHAAAKWLKERLGEKEVDPLMLVDRKFPTSPQP